MIEQQNGLIRKEIRMKKENELIKDLCKALSEIQNKEVMLRFLRDLCTPQEINALAERWSICQLLDEGELSYREINKKTGVSLATITRVARFLKDEPHHGYKTMLKTIKKKKILKK